MAGVTTRTIQRIEQGHRPSMETCRALASVFEVDLSLLQPGDEQMHNETELKADEQQALLYAKRMKEFYEFLITYVVLAAVFFVYFSRRVCGLYCFRWPWRRADRSRADRI